MGTQAALPCPIGCVCFSPCTLVLGLTYGAALLWRGPESRGQPHESKCSPFPGQVVPRCTVPKLLSRKLFQRPCCRGTELGQVASVTALCPRLPLLLTLEAVGAARRGGSSHWLCGHTAWDHIVLCQ